MTTNNNSGHSGSSSYLIDLKDFIQLKSNDCPEKPITRDVFKPSLDSTLFINAFPASDKTNVYYSMDLYRPPSGVVVPFSFVGKMDSLSNYEIFPQLIFDFDCEKIGTGANKTIDVESLKSLVPRVMSFFRRMVEGGLKANEDFYAHFSGRAGFHVVFPYYKTGVEVFPVGDPAREDKLKFIREHFIKSILDKYAVGLDLKPDDQVFGKNHLCRVAYQKHSGSGKYSFILSESNISDLDFTLAKLYEIAEKPIVSKIAPASNMELNATLNAIYKTVKAESDAIKPQEKKAVSLVGAAVSSFNEDKGARLDALLSQCNLGYPELLAYMGFLVHDCRLDWPGVSARFGGYFGADYKEKNTRASYDDCVKKTDVKKGGTLLQYLKEKGFEEVRAAVVDFENSCTNRAFNVNAAGDQKKSRRVINNEWAVEYVKKHSLICFNGSYYFFNGRYYEWVDPEIIGTHINLFLGNEFTPGQRKDILEKIHYSSVITEKDFNIEVGELCLLNGVYNVKDHTIIPHSPKKIFFGCFDFNYYIGVVPEPNGFDKFFDELFPRAEHRAAKETYLKFMGYCLSDSTQHHLGLIMESEGRSGKSETQKFFRGIFPAANYAEFQELSNLYGDFKNEDLEHARVAYVDDADKGSRFNEGCLKTIIQGGKILINPKSRKPFKIMNRSKLIVGTNKDNNFLDSHGIGDLERWIVINFPMTFTEELGNVDRDKHKELLASQDIKDRAGYILVENLRAILKSGKFDVPASIRASSREKLQKGNWFYQFAKNHLYYANSINDSVAKSDIYKIAVAWALSQGHKGGASARTFWDEMKRAAKCGSLFDVPVKNGGMYKKNGIDHLCGVAIMGLDVLKLEDGKTVKAVHETAIPHFDDEKHGPISIADMNYNDYLLEMERRANLPLTAPEPPEAVGVEIGKTYKLQEHIETLKNEVVEKVRQCETMIESGEKKIEHFKNTVIGNLKMSHKITHLNTLDDLKEYVNRPKIDLPWHLEKINEEVNKFIYGPSWREKQPIKKVV